MAQIRLERQSTTGPAEQAAARREEHTGLDISIRSGSGSGRTLLSAFDHALQRAGVADFNLVTLSSIIPPGSRIRSVDSTLPGGHGDLLFCVRAEAFAEHPGDIAWAGLGWCVDESGGGLFVEHHGGSEQSVIEQIELSLADMNANRGGGYGPVQMAMASAHCTGLPACALVLAAYRVSTWDDPHNEGRPQRSGSAADRDLDTTAALDSLSPNGQGATGLATAEPRARETAMIAKPGAVEKATTAGAVRVTIEKEVDYVTARRYYELYRATFGELEAFAVARQLLNEAEFLAEMLDPRVHKYVAWDDEEQAIGMTTLTSDLETVPWIEPGYFAHRYPDHYARGAVYYLGFTLVHPDHRGAGVFKAMIEHMVDTALTQSIIFAWDMCLANDAGGFGGGAGRLLQSLTNGTVQSIDQQTYYATEMSAKRKPAPKK